MWGIEVGQVRKGVVIKANDNGAYIDLPGIKGFLHAANISWRRIVHASDVLKKGDEIEVIVLHVDAERVDLGIKQLEPDPWATHIPQKYREGEIVSGEVVKITNFGAFVKLEQDLEGLLHISEMGERRVKSPEDIVHLGQKLDVRIIKSDSEVRKIRLSLRRNG